MKNIVLFPLFCLLLIVNTQAVSQATTNYSQSISCEDKQFDEVVNSYINYSVPVISVNELSENIGDYILLDTRKEKEYQLSHIPGALHMGYKKPNMTILDSIDYNQPIVVYCSIGVRSEKIGEKLLANGYTNVKNLYGSIFEWTNQGNTVVDNSNNITYKVHGYDKSWSKWILNPKYEREY